MLQLSLNEKIVKVNFSKLVEQVRERFLILLGRWHSLTGKHLTRLSIMDNYSNDDRNCKNWHNRRAKPGSTKIATCVHVLHFTECTCKVHSQRDALIQVVISSNILAATLCELQTLFCKQLDLGPRIWPIGIYGS